MFLFFTHLHISPQHTHTTRALHAIGTLQKNVYGSAKRILYLPHRVHLCCGSLPCRPLLDPVHNHRLHWKLRRHHSGIRHESQRHFNTHFRVSATDRGRNHSLGCICLGVCVFATTGRWLRARTFRRQTGLLERWFFRRWNFVALLALCRALFENLINAK